VADDVLVLAVVVFDEEGQIDVEDLEEAEVVGHLVLERGGVEPVGAVRRVLGHEGVRRGEEDDGAGPEELGKMVEEDVGIGQAAEEVGSEDGVEGTVVVDALVEEGRVGRVAVQKVAPRLGGHGEGLVAVDLDGEAGGEGARDVGKSAGVVKAEDVVEARGGGEGRAAQPTSKNAPRVDAWSARSSAQR